MLSNTQLTILRTVASAVLTALAALYSVYPSYTWITIVIAAFGVLGIHAIPSINQVASSTGGSTVNGTDLMGITKPTPDEPTPVAAPEPAPEPVAEVPAPVAVEDSNVRTAPVEAAPAAVSPEKQAVLDALAALGEAIKNL